MKPAKNLPDGSKSNATRRKALTTYSRVQRITPRKIDPTILMADPQRLADACTTYLNITSDASSPPTFEGLALSAGFNSFSQMRQAILSDEHPQSAKDSLIIACAHIANFYQQAGLLDGLNAPFIKYLLSAYLNISEKHVTERTSTDDRTVTIRWEQPSHDPHAQTRQEARQAIAEQKGSRTALEDELAELEIEDLF